MPAEALGEICQGSEALLLPPTSSSLGLAFSACLALCLH